MQPCVTLKAGPVKFQSEAMRVAMMLPMLLVYEVAVLTSETYESSVLCSAVSVSCGSSPSRSRSATRARWR